jgi:deazaflavin-dependent oxidoreductase (nitroreductase family)
MNGNDVHADRRAGIRIPHPKGIFRLALRAPIILYRWHLGFLLGNRFVYLEHRGRRSGILRHVVIEVADYDPTVRSVVVVAAWGDKADWYENIQADPHVTITLGAKRYPAVARTLTKDEAKAHLQAYARRHPAAFEELDVLVEGLGRRKPDEIIRTFLDTMPVVEFLPVKANGRQDEGPSA